MSHYYSWIFRIFPWNAPLKTWRSSATAARWRAPVPPPWWRQRSPRGRAARCQRLSWLHVVQTHSLYEYLYVIYMDSLYYIDYRFFGGGPYQFPVFFVQINSWTLTWRSCPCWVYPVRCSTNAYRWIIAILQSWTRKKEEMKETRDK